MFKIFILFSINFGFFIFANVAPELDLYDEEIGYSGKIRENSILVELIPHLQIKNSEKINGICSYHIYKPTDEDFPFYIEIKDKFTGEAVVQLAKNEKEQYNKIDCKLRKFYKFFIEAHDCTEPTSLASKKIPVTIEILDHNDYKLSFDEKDYYRSLVENEINENLLMIKAKDNDCTNNGLACSYKIIDETLPFQIDKLGFLSNKIGLKRSEKENYDFIVRGYDCLDSESYAETTVHIEIIEPCVPQWKEFEAKQDVTESTTNLFDKITLSLCDAQNLSPKCEIETLNSKVKLDLNTFSNGCEVEKCGEVLSKTELLSDTDSDEKLEPKIFSTFTSINDDSVIKSNFDGNFGDSFIIKAWIRRTTDNLDTDIKEHIFCGTDSESMNRHHYGMYFYKKNFKFLLRREHQLNISNESKFFPSLWEWSLNNIEGDKKWHFYELRYDYPNVQLFIDGIKYEENQTNSDIIDAYELDQIVSTGLRQTYIGACYHARSHTFVDHFEGDVAGLSLFKKDSLKTIECIKNCKEYLELNMIGNENYLESVDNSQHDEISIQTTNLNDMLTLLKKIYFINEFSTTKFGQRFIKLDSKLKCKGNDQEMELKPVLIELNIKLPKQDFSIQLDGNKQISIVQDELANGVQMFNEMNIIKIPINKMDDDNDDDEDDGQSANELITFEKCLINVLPDGFINTETIIYSDYLMDKYKLKFTKTANSVQISGVKSIEIYENFIRNLVYVNDYSEQQQKLQPLPFYKQFYLSCMRNEPNTQTNTIFVQINVTLSYVALKRMHKFTVNDEVIENKLNNPNTNNDGLKASSPVIVLLIVVSTGLLSFLVVFTIIKIKSSRDKRRGITNEENPQMEWDDSGLNITENPLEEMDAINFNKNTVEFEDDSSTDESNRDESDEEEPEKIVDRELEWDDTTLEINIRNEANNKLKNNLDLNTPKIL